MKKTAILFLIIFIFTGYIFAQEDDAVPVSAEEDSVVPFLTESDISAIETVLPEDKAFRFQDEKPSLTWGTADNEMSRLNASHPVYHLLVLDRVYCPNSDITDADNMQILYKYKHGRNGYLIALYVSPAEGPVFPQMPARSRIFFNLSTVHKNTILEYVNSNVFRRFVTSRTILRQLREALRK
ncbi:MAG: hypothetical protein FWH41_05015 [Treponema sp.]|nr:hypothetical protein [Treponema sp.]